MATASRVRTVAVVFALMSTLGGAWLATSGWLTLSAVLSAVAPTAKAEAASLGVKGRSNATPWVAASGPFVAVTWGASADGKTDVFVAVSRDSGQTFGRPVQANTIAGEARLGGELPPRVALEPRAGSADPDVAVLWTARSDTTQIKVARSRDGGKTFGPAVMLQSSGVAGDRGWPALAMDQKGTAHAIWLDHRGLAAEGSHGAHRKGHQSGAEHDGVAMAQKSGLYYAAAAESPVSERPLTGGVCYCCKTALAVGDDGALYAAWRHVYAGNMRDMAFTVSRDGGRSFSPPARVSRDEWAINGCPDDGPAMAIDATGTIHLIWPTVLAGATPEGALFYATTRDGQTFTPRVRIPTLGSPKPSHPQIVIDPAGRVAAAWDELLDGKRTAVVREITRGANQTIAFGEPVRLAAGSASTYPVLASTTKGLVAVWTSGTGPTSAIGVRAIELPKPR